MRVLIQRVSDASVTVDGKVTGQINAGLLLFAGFKNGDTKQCVDKLAAKIARLRIFSDNVGKMNLSLQDIGGALLIVSQFTLYADVSKGNRPSYWQAATPEIAEQLYSYFVEACQSLGFPVSTGIFRAHMKVCLTNDGPVTILCDSDD